MALVSERVWVNWTSFFFLEGFLLSNVTSPIKNHSLGFASIHQTFANLMYKLDPSKVANKWVSLGCFWMWSLKTLGDLLLFTIAKPYLN